MLPSGDTIGIPVNIKLCLPLGHFGSTRRQSHHPGRGGRAAAIQGEQRDIFLGSGGSPEYLLVPPPLTVTENGEKKQPLPDKGMVTRGSGSPG